MPLVSMRQLLDHAAENGYGLPAFNVNNLEQVQAIMAAASETNSPVIMQASAGARKYAGEVFLRHLIEAAVETYPDIPVVMHQDHGQSPEVCLGAIRLGFSSVMMDGSLEEDGKSIADYDYNVDVTRRVVEMSHARRRHRRRRARMPGLARDDARRQGRRPRRRRHDDARDAAHRSRPGRRLRQARRSSTRSPSPSARRTARTSSRASRPATSSPSTASRRSTARIPNTHLVMHGSSSVPQDLLAEIRDIRRRHEGNLRRAGRGDPGRHQHGVRKINIDTDIRLAMTGAIRRYMAENPSKFDPRDYLKPAMAAAKTGVQGALRAVRLRGHGVEDQAAAARQHGGVQGRRAKQIVN